MMGFFFTPTDELEIEEDARKSLPDNTAEVLDASIFVLEKIDEANWKTETLQTALAAELIEKLELKPRIAYGPLRVAISGRRVSPPLFESMEILGKDVSLLRLKRLAEAYA